jgi:NAD(P)-dependent dehydrogenase (short-subunit alcohol dehydrogenase family)
MRHFQIFENRKTLRIFMDLKLIDKVALVTGSTAGIGFAIAKTLACEGAKVIINGRTNSRVVDAIQKIHSECPDAKLEPLATDLSLPEMAEQTFGNFPAVDILVNNLGVYQLKPFHEIRDDEWQDIIETNFMSGVRLSRSYLPYMLQENWGRIIFISSESAVNIPAEMIHYGVTKTMQLALSSGLAELTAGTNVTVNSILPGPTRSEGVENFLSDVAASQKTEKDQVEKEFFTNVRPSSLIKRFATTDEVAALAAFVASPLSSAINGAALRVEGGIIRSIV